MQPSESLTSGGWLGRRLPSAVAATRSGVSVISAAASGGAVPSLLGARCPWLDVENRRRIGSPEDRSGLSCWALDFLEGIHWEFQNVVATWGGECLVRITDERPVESQSGYPFGG